MYLHHINNDRMIDVRNAREDARRVALESCGHGHVKSRGMEITGSADGTKVTEGGTWTWDGTSRGLVDTVNTLQDRFPGLDEVWIEGGFDWAESLTAYVNGDYDPLVSDWAVLVWKKS